MSGRNLSKARVTERAKFIDPRGLVPPMSMEERANASLGPRHMIAASWKEFVPGQPLAVQREKAVERRGTFMSVFKLAQKLFPGAMISIRCLEPQPSKEQVLDHAAPAAITEKVE